MSKIKKRLARKAVKSTAKHTARIGADGAVAVPEVPRV